MDMITTDEHVKMIRYAGQAVCVSVLFLSFHAFTCLYTYIAVILSLAIDIRDSTGTVI